LLDGGTKVVNQLKEICSELLSTQNELKLADIEANALKVVRETIGQMTDDCSDSGAGIGIFRHCAEQARFAGAAHGRSNAARFSIEHGNRQGL